MISALLSGEYRLGDFAKDVVRYYAPLPLTMLVAAGIWHGSLSHHRHLPIIKLGESDGYERLVLARKIADGWAGIYTKTATVRNIRVRPNQPGPGRYDPPPLRLQDYHDNIRP